MSDPFLGEIRVFAGSFAPRGWSQCDGSLLSIQQYSALFAILGTTYGGNGTQTFALPDLRGRVVVGTGNGPGLTPYVEGESGGSESVTMNVNQMPRHNHGVTAQGQLPDQPGPDNNFLASNGRGGTNFYTSVTTAPTNMNPNMIQPVGGSQPVPLLQPYLSIIFIIALEGIFPPRP